MGGPYGALWREILDKPQLFQYAFLRLCPEFRTTEVLQPFQGSCLFVTAHHLELRPKLLPKPSVS